MQTVTSPNDPKTAISQKRREPIDKTVYKHAEHDLRGSSIFADAVQREIMERACNNIIDHERAIRPGGN